MEISTSIVKRFTENSFSAAYGLTIGSAFAAKDVVLQREDGEEVKVKCGFFVLFTDRLHIWDTAGEEQYRSMTRFFLREAVVGLVVYDITDATSATNMDSWISCLLEDSPEAQVLVVGNKNDSPNRKVSQEDILHYAAANQFETIECSAKSGENISEVFCKAAVIAYKTKHSNHGSVKVTHILCCVCCKQDTSGRRSSRAKPPSPPAVARHPFPPGTPSRTRL